MRKIMWIVICIGCVFMIGSFVVASYQVKQVKQVKVEKINIKNTKQYKEREKAIIENEKWTVKKCSDGASYIRIQKIHKGYFANPNVRPYGDCYTRLVVTSDDLIGLFISEHHKDKLPVWFSKGGVLRIRNNHDKVIEIYDVYKWSEKGGIEIKDQRLINLIKESSWLHITAYDPATKSCYIIPEVNVRSFTKTYNSIK